MRFLFGKNIVKFENLYLFFPRNDIGILMKKLEVKKIKHSKGQLAKHNLNILI